MHLLTPNHSLKTRWSPETFISATIVKKCGVKTRSGRAGMLYPENPLRPPLPKIDLSDLN